MFPFCPSVYKYSDSKNMRFPLISHFLFPNHIEHYRTTSHLMIHESSSDFLTCRKSRSCAVPSKVARSGTSVLAFGASSRINGKRVILPILPLKSTQFSLRIWGVGVSPWSTLYLKTQTSKSSKSSNFNFGSEDDDFPRQFTWITIIFHITLPFLALPIYWHQHWGLMWAPRGAWSHPRAWVVAYCTWPKTPPFLGDFLLPRWKILEGHGNIKKRMGLFNGGIFDHQHAEQTGNPTLNMGVAARGDSLMGQIQHFWTPRWKTSWSPGGLVKRHRV